MYVSIFKNLIPENSLIDNGWVNLCSEEASDGSKLVVCADSYSLVSENDVVALNCKSESSLLSSIESVNNEKHSAQLINVCDKSWSNHDMPT